MATTWDGAAQEHPVIAESSPGRHVAGVRVWEGVPLISGPRAKRCCMAGQREHGGTVHAAGWRRVDSCARGEPPASLPLGVWDGPWAPRVHVSCAEGHQPADHYILDDQPAQGWVSGWVPPRAVRRPPVGLWHLQSESQCDPQPLPDFHPHMPVWLHQHTEQAPGATGFPRRWAAMNSLRLPPTHGSLLMTKDTATPHPRRDHSAGAQRPAFCR